MRKLLFILLAGVITLMSCEKDDPKSRTELLCEVPWLLSSSKVNPAIYIEEIETSVTDFYAIYESVGLQCVLDDIWNFNENGTYTKEEGETKCDPSDPVVFETGNWAFNADETILTTTTANQYGTFMSEYTILDLSSKNLSLEYTAVDSNNVVYTFKKSYRHE